MNIYDVTVYLPTILAISSARLVIPRKKSETRETIYHLIAVILGLIDIALAAITYDELKASGVYSLRVPIVLVLVGLTLTHKLYSHEYAPALFATISGIIAVVLVYTYLNITSYVLLGAVFVVTAGIVYSIVSYVFAVLGFITRLLNRLPFRLSVAAAGLVVAIAIAAGYPLPPV